MIFKSAFFTPIILFAAIWSFSSCNNKSGDASNSEKSTSAQIERPEQIEIKMVGQWLGQADREKFIREFVREYNFLHQDKKISMVFYEDLVGSDRGGQALNQWSAEQVMAEQSDFDLLMINNVNNIVPDDPEWAEKYLVDFSEIEEFRENTVDGLIEEYKERWGGIIPGPLIEGYYYALWCNLNVAEKVGIEVKQTGMTFEDFKGYLKAVHEYNQTASEEDRIYGIFEAGDWSTLVNVFNQLFLSVLDDNEAYFSDELTEKKLQAWHETLKLLEELAPYNPLQPDWQSLAWDDSYPKMLNDKYLFFSNATWMYNFWQAEENENLFNIMPTEYPTIKPVDYYIGGYQIMWVVPKNAKHREEAIDILLAMNKPKVADKWGRYTKTSTGIKAQLTSSAMGGDHFENFITEIENKYGENKIALSGNNKYIFNYDQRFTANMAHEVLTGKMTADEAMETLRSKFTN